MKFIYRKLYYFIEKGCSKLNAVMLSDQSQSFCENAMTKCEAKKIVIVEIPHTLCFDKKKNLNKTIDKSTITCSDFNDLMNFHDRHFFLLLF